MQGHDNDAPGLGELAELRARVAELQDKLDVATAEQLMNRSVLDTIPAVVLRVSLTGVIEFINKVLPEYAGATLIGQSIYAFAPADQHDQMREALERTTRTREPTSYEAIAEAPDGTREWYLTNVGPILDGDHMLGLRLVCLNTSQLKAAEKALVHSRAQLNMALEAGNVGLWHWDRLHDVVEWDDKLCTMFGLTREEAPLTAEAFVAMLPADQQGAMGAHIAQAVEHGVYPDFQLRADFPSGTKWFVIKGGVLRDDSGNVTGLLGGVVDDTSRRKLEDQLHQSQKLDAVGHLSAGIAHNFNNMLAVIMPTLELAKRELPKLTALDDALDAAGHAAQLVRQLLVFSRGNDVSKARTEPLSQTIRRATDLCRETFDRRIEVQLHGLDDVQNVFVDGADMEQVFVNLLLNARDALEHAAGANHILIKLRTLSPEETRLRHPGATGCSAEVCVSDNGVGMDEAMRSRVFEPFFTTKAPGHGTGLGLSTAWATTLSHRGLIECDSSPGRGTTFTLLLRSSEPTLEPATATATSAQRRYDGHVALVIDDEPTVRRTLAALLDALGFSVMTAESGAEGVRQAESRPVDICLLDYSMPGQPAEQTLLQLRQVRPSVRIVCCSGLGVELAGANARLAKPFGLTELSSLLYNLFDE